MFEHQGYRADATARARSMRRRMTWSEQRLWPELRKLCANFRRQAPIGRYFADFACHAQQLVIEVDGGIHERLPEVAARDFERQQWLEGQGYRVLRFTDRPVANDLQVCVDAVRKALALPLDGGGLGGGVFAEMTGKLEWALAPNGASRLPDVRTPPSPALPPSRRKGGALPPILGEGE
jgi:very-short-patch-repair endonuclease